MKKSPFKFLIGTSGWRYFYPKNYPKTRWFDYYAEHFHTVEVNATFYRRFKDETYQKWYNISPEDFRYVLKAPQFITHRKYLKDVIESIREFERSAKLLKNKLGLILLQRPPNMPYDLDRLAKALKAF